MKEKAEGAYPTLAAELQHLERFTQPEDLGTEAEIKGKDAEGTRYNRGLVIGRFQPLHRGHIALFKEALANARMIIIGIGSANVTNEDNPFTAEDREILLERALRREGIRDRVEKIIRLDDYHDSQKWLEATLEQTGEIDVVFGGNEWVNGIFDEAGYSVEHVERHGYEGTKIREQLRREGRLS